MQIPGRHQEHPVYHRRQLDLSTCTVYVSDENGLCVFALEPREWELHTLMVPAGYAGDTEAVTDSAGGELVFELTKN